MTMRALYVRLREPLSESRARLAILLLSVEENPSDLFIQDVVDFLKRRSDRTVLRLTERLKAGREAVELEVR